MQNKSYSNHIPSLNTVKRKEKAESFCKYVHLRRWKNGKQGELKKGDGLARNEYTVELSRSSYRYYNSWNLDASTPIYTLSDATCPPDRCHRPLSPPLPFSFASSGYITLESGQLFYLSAPTEKCLVAVSSSPLPLRIHLAALPRFLFSRLFPSPPVFRLSSPSTTPSFFFFFWPLFSLSFFFFSRFLLLSLFPRSLVFPSNSRQNSPCPTDSDAVSFPVKANCTRCFLSSRANSTSFLVAELETGSLS